MKFWSRFLWVAVIVCLLAPISVNAEDAALTDSEKTQTAGELLAGVMDLLIERFVGEDISPEYLYESALRGMMDSLDPYSQYLSKDELDELQKGFSGKMYGIGITLDVSGEKTPYVKSVLAGSPADKSGLMKGDILLEVNKQTAEGLSLHDILSIIDKTDIVSFKIQRGAETFEKSVEKQTIEVPTVTSEPFEGMIDPAKKHDNSALRYVAISEFGDETAREFGDMINKLREEGVKRIAIDLRGNPGGYADSVIKICNLIVPKGPIMFTINKKGVETQIYSVLEEEPFEKIAVLTDRGTASAAEVLASALQDSKAAVIIGETTYGKGVIQSLYPLPAGGAVKFTTEEYLRRNGEKINNIGVIPDIRVEVPGFIMDPVELDDNNASDTLPAIRNALSYLGYSFDPVENENIYDNSLKSAVRQFQSDADIKVNGDLDTDTLTQLNSAVYKSYSKEDRVLEQAYDTLREGL